MENRIPESLKAFEIPGRVTLIEGNGELPKVQVVTDWSVAEIYLHGAQVTDFQKKGDAPLLFLSQFSRFTPNHPIRGGIPIVFPWFGAREGEPAHGFARVCRWALHEAIAVPEGGVSVRFSMPETPESATFPSFSAVYAVTVTDKLELQLIITNTSLGDVFTFENCLHTYFGISDLSEVSIRGLKGLTYSDQTDHFTQKTEAADAVTLQSEVDRTYYGAVGPVEIHDPKLGRKILIEKSGSQSTVVWNPGTSKAQEMPDFGNEEYRQMVCVESGNVGPNKVSLLPGKSSVLQVKLSTLPL